MIVVLVLLLGSTVWEGQEPGVRLDIQHRLLVIRLVPELLESSGVELLTPA